jgi:alpha-tubulin suppressor-like RCC1 family protein
MITRLVPLLLVVLSAVGCHKSHGRDPSEPDSAVHRDERQHDASVGESNADGDGGSDAGGYEDSGHGSMGDGDSVGEVRPPTTPPTLPPVLGLGPFHACIVDQGKLYCWGRNESGQLGLGDNEERHVPTRVGRASDWLSVSAGLTHSCGIRAVGASDGGQRFGALYCWGRGAVGMDDATTLVPVQVGSETSWRWISAGKEHSCGILAGALYCWGSNKFGQLGTTGLYQRTPLRVGSRTDWSLSTAWTSTCGIAGGALYCWGSSQYGQLGTGVASDLYPHPDLTQVGTDVDWTSVALGGWHGCGTRVTGSLRCWGYNNFGQLGFNTTGAVILSPRAVEGHEDGWMPTTTDLGGNHSCWVRNGDLYCWGANGAGQSGSEWDVDRAPRLVSSGGWQTVAASGEHSCGLRRETLHCWGSNQYGQVGVGNTDDQPQPVPVEL